MHAPEFSRPIKVDQIGRQPGSVHISATDDERAALCRRFGLVSLDRLDADYTLTEDAGIIKATGHVHAALAQPCSATGEPVPEIIDTDFTLRFVQDSEEQASDELELDANDCDTIDFDGQVVDMGEAVAETISLTMQPYPRAKGADKFLREAGVITEDQASPFAILQALNLKDGKKG